MQAGTESDDLDRRLLAAVFVILRDIRRIVEREIHHRRVIHIHLQDQVVRLSSDSALQHLRRRCVLLERHRRVLLLLRYR